MGRDRGRRVRGGRGRGGGVDSSPVEQLEIWRDWRHDTAEFPAVPHGDDELDQSAGTRRRRRRPRAGIVIGAALLVAALAVGGLTALGVGPVAQLVSSGSDETPVGGATPSTGGASTSADPTVVKGASSAGASGGASPQGPPEVGRRADPPKPPAKGPPG